MLLGLCVCCASYLDYCGLHNVFACFVYLFGLCLLKYYWLLVLRLIVVVFVDLT